MPSTDELERQGISGRQLKVLPTSWGKVATEYKAKQQGIRKFYEAEVGVGRGRAASQMEGEESDVQPPRKRTRQMDIRQFGKQSTNGQKYGSAGRREDAGEGGSREVEADTGENVRQGEG